jgi:hypothetical protein
MSLSGSEKAHRLQLALECGGPTHRLDDVVACLRDGRARLWENDGGVIVTELETFPLHKAVRFWLIAGELKPCLALEHEIVPWALSQGCTIAIASGRRGWGRVAASTGWRQHSYIFWKSLENGHDVE